MSEKVGSRAHPSEKHAG